MTLSSQQSHMAPTNPGDLRHQQGGWGPAHFSPRPLTAGNSWGMTQSALQGWEPGPAAQMFWLQLWL